MAQYALPLALTPDFSAVNFSVSACNEEAFRRVTAWPDWPAHALLIYGPHASGKSHLGHIWAERAQARLLAADAPWPPLDAMGGNWLIEDIERLEGERTLLHLFNAARENGASLLLTSATAPASLPFTLPDLTSRLLSMPQAALSEADDALLAIVLAKQFADRQLKIAPEALAYLLSRMERSLGAAATMAERLDRLSLAEGKALTIPFVKHALSLE